MSTTRLRWHDQRKPAQADAVLVPVTYDYDAACDPFHNLSDPQSSRVTLSHPMPPHPGTLNPRRHVYVLRIDAAEWERWVLTETNRASRGTFAPGEFTDQHNGARWAVTPEWGAPHAFTARPLPCTFPWPPAVDLYAEAEPLMLDRYVSHRPPPPVAD